MKVFLSYSAEDREVAKDLATQLANAGLETWDPAEALFPGDNWALRIGKALEEADAMIVLVSPKSRFGTSWNTRSPRLVTRAVCCPSW